MTLADVLARKGINGKPVIVPTPEQCGEYPVSAKAVGQVIALVHSALEPEPVEQGVPVTVQPDAQNVNTSNCVNPSPEIPLAVGCAQVTTPTVEIKSTN